MIVYAVDILNLHYAMTLAYVLEYHAALVAMFCFYKHCCVYM